MAGLVCPQCGYKKSFIKDSRPVADGIRRRRECENCSHRWTTYECGSDLMTRLINKGYETGLKMAIERIAKNESKSLSEMRK